MSSRLAKPAAHPATIAAIPLFPPAYLSDPEELSFREQTLNLQDPLIASSHRRDTLTR